MAVASLAVRVSAQIAELQKGMADGTKAVNQFASGFEGVATRAAAVGTFIGGIAKDMAQALISNLGRAFSEAISLSQKFSNAFIGLSSVARAFGSNVDATTAAARRLSADGLLPIGDAATGLKNLLATGFSLPQAIRLMEAFKDSAAFGRQGALSFGDAVRTATEGVKNGNSILLDNAGLTKNGSVIMTEAGKAAKDFGRLSQDAALRNAFLAGAIKETAAQAGDAARLTQTYTGQVTKLTTQYQTFLATLGDSITQNKTVAVAIGYVSVAFGKLATWLTTNSNGFNLVSDAVILFVRVGAGVVRTVDVMQRAFNALDSSLNLTVKEFSTGVAAIANQLVNLLGVLAKIPGSGVVLAAFTNELVSLLSVQKASNDLTREMSKRLTENEVRTKTWSATLGRAAGTLDDLAETLKATRGQTVEFGVATNVLARSLNTVDEAAEKARKKIQKILDSMPSWRHGLAGMSVSALGTSFEITMPPILFDSMIPFAGLKEGLQSLPGEVIKMQIPKGIIKPISEAFQEFGRELPGIIFGTLQSGGNLVGAIAAGLAAKFTDSFEKAVDIARKAGEKLSTNQAALGAVGVGLSAFIGGYGIGMATASKTKGMLGGAATGALAGAAYGSVVPGIGTAVGAGVGALVGAVGGFFGGRSAEKKAQEALEQNKIALLEQFGGMKKLSELATKLGVNIQAAFDAKKPAQFQAAVDSLNAAIERQNEKWAGMQQAIEGVNAKAKLFAAPFQKLLDARAELAENKDADPLQLKALDAKLAETAQRGQAEFERLGTFVGATFAGMVRETGDAIGAITSMVPAFQVLKDGIEKFGLSSTGTISALVGMFKALNDETTGPLFASLQATGQIFSGLQQGGLLTKDLFQTVGADIGAIFAEMESKGVDMSVAMALSQPILQKLWEGQKLFGQITDETTRKILDQAAEQGLVGDHMKDVNQKILDVLIIIAEVFGATIPDALRGLPPVARDAARGVTDALATIRAPELRIPVRFDIPDVPGIDMDSRDRFETTIELDGDVIARSTARRLPEYVIGTV